MKEKYTKITDLMALTVFAVFALCVLAVLLYGAGVYQNLVRCGEDSFEARTAAQYVATRVRQAESVTVADFEGCEALVIPEEIDGAHYVTRVYCYDGYIRELFCAENAHLSPGDGEKIMPADSLHFSVEDGLLAASVNDRQVLLHLRSEGEEMP